MNSVCVFASSSSLLDEAYYIAAERLGSRLAEEDITVVFGAGADGLMGALARGVKASGGRLVGVIPELLDLPGVAFAHCDEIIRTKTMRERKALMAERADAFIALPGGFGTLEELLEVITLKQLGVHDKPIAVINTNGFYAHMIAQFEATVSQRFAQRGLLGAFGVYEDIGEAVEYLNGGEKKSGFLKHEWLKAEV